MTINESKVSHHFCCGREKGNGNNYNNNKIRLMGFFPWRACTLALFAISQGLLVVYVNGDLNYKDALTKSIIFLEAQRSGKLPPNHRPSWRGDSALDDGKLDNVDLVGGYYDAGDNIKFGLPMAFSITILSWAAIFYESEFTAAGEINNALASIRWGTDYLLKASSKPGILYVQVGDPVKDHECWVAPENMKTPRTVLKIDQNTPGTEIAGETSAALAAASIVFKQRDSNYACILLDRAKAVYQFAKDHRGTFDGECPFYCSYSGFNDELLWSGAWLYMATKEPIYLQHVKEAISSSVSEFGWDLKFAGAQVLLTNLYFEGHKDLEKFKHEADSFICSIHPKSPHHNVFITPGGLVYLREGANTQHVTSTAFLFSIYGDLLSKYKQRVSCGNKRISSAQVQDFAKKQIDYLLGENPMKRSYMVGFGIKPPTQAHHRGASVPRSNNGGQQLREVDCPTSFAYWFEKDVPNPNELTGAIVGGPDKQDYFEDKRKKSSMTEPTTYTNSLAIGVLAKLAIHRTPAF